MSMMEYLQQYAKRFGDGFPTIPLAWGRSEAEVIDIIKECLEKGKDVYEMGLLSDDEDVEY